MSRAAQSQIPEATAAAAAAMMGARARPAAGPACTGPQAPPPRNHRVGNRTRSSRWGAQDSGIPRPRRKSLWRLEGERRRRRGRERRASAQTGSGTRKGSPRGPSQRPQRHRGPNRQHRLPPHVAAARCPNPSATRKVGKGGLGTR